MNGCTRLRIAISCAALSLFTGCGLPQSMLNPQGRAANYISTLVWIEVIVLCAITFGMWLLIGWAAARKKGSLETHERINVTGGQKWILVGGFAIPFVVLSTLFGLTMNWMSNFPIPSSKRGSDPKILVIGHQWWWELHYVSGPPSQQFITANEIHIPVGRPVDIELETADVIHSFWVPQLHGKVDEIPGQPNFIRIEADHPGVFRGQCAEYCGEEHARMVLVVVAQPEQEYEAWRAHELQPAAVPSTDEARHGEEVFMSAGCPLCHMVRGTMALGTVAPNLTHVGSRLGLASNYYPNNTANLESWITHAQSLKPGAEMPDLTQFNGPDIRALVSYVQHLN